MYVRDCTTFSLMCNQSHVNIVTNVFIAMCYSQYRAVFSIENALIMVEPFHKSIVIESKMTYFFLGIS